LRNRGGGSTQAERKRAKKIAVRGDKQGATAQDRKPQNKTHILLKSKDTRENLGPSGGN